LSTLPAEHDKKEMSSAGYHFEVVVNLYAYAKDASTIKEEWFVVAIKEAKRSARKLIGRQEDGDDDGLDLVVGDMKYFYDEGYREQLVKVRKLE
jgi:hypothetical protein